MSLLITERGFRCGSLNTFKLKKSFSFKTLEAQDPLHLVAFQDPRDQCETTNLREPPRLLLLQTKAEAGICSVFKSSSSTEVRVGLAGGAGKQQAGVGHKPPLR